MAMVSLVAVPEHYGLERSLVKCHIVIVAISAILTGGALI